MNISPSIIRETWLDCQEPCAEKEAKEKAMQLNAERFNEKLPSHSYGFAKAICKVAKDHHHVNWHVRILESDLNSQQNQKDEQNLKERSVSLLPASFSAIKPSMQGDLIPLLVVICNTLASIQKRRNQIEKPEVIGRKLNKLLIYLLQTPSWPYPKKENSIENIARVFTHYQSCHLGAQNQFSFHRFVSHLSKGLHQQFMTLDEVSSKILTKTKRSLPAGLLLFDRIKGLLNFGTERILLTKRQNQDVDVEIFSRIFAGYTYVFKPDVDQEKAKLELQASVDKLVEFLMAYDNRHRGAITLFNFGSKVMRYLVKHFNKERILDETTLSSFIWTLEALAHNEAFIKHMQPPVRRHKVIADMASELFLNRQVWHAIADLMVFLGNKDLFNQVLEQSIDSQHKMCFLDPFQINVIFSNLNKKLREEKGNRLLELEFREMYLRFLEIFANNNQLHLLKPYARFGEHQRLLRNNLSEKLDFSFMDDPSLPLDTFFGNGAYRAINQRNIPHGMNVRRTIMRLFTRYGENPIIKEKDFDETLTKILADFNNGLELICEKVLGKLGEISAPGIEEIEDREKLIAVEEWLLKNVITNYQSLRLYIFLCLPLKWEEETCNGARNLLHRTCLHDEKLFMLDYDAERELVLKDPFTENPLLHAPSHLYVSDVIDEVKTHLNHLMKLPANQDAVAYLTEAYMSLHHHEQIKSDIKKMLDDIFKKMRQQSSVSFQKRIHILADFFHVISPFFKKLDDIVIERFFPKGKFKKNIVHNLIQQSIKAGHQVGPSLQEIDAIVDSSPHVVQDLSRLVSPLCIQDIQDILERCSLSELANVTSQFEYVICRKIDEISYTKEEFKQAFCTRDANKNQVPAGQLERVIGDLDIKEQIIAEYGNFLKNRPVPIHFILPNQALAIQLCLHPDFNDRNLLIKLGTGQGKSLVIALAALHEARKIKEKPHGRVFVFTSYDHLAKRDHELGANFFKKDHLKSICISTIEDVANIDASTKIIYADIENIDDIIQDIMLKLLQNKATPPEKEFIKIIYGNPSEDIRVILDEYDLLLHDLEGKEPFVKSISEEILPVNFVRSNSVLWPYLADETRKQEDRSQSKQSANLSSGKEFSYLSYYAPREKMFNLPVSIMRLSKILKRAKRVIGLSGTALQGENHCVHQPLFFEIPSSQNPEIFGTKIQEDPNIKLLTDDPCIVCRQKLQFDFQGKEDDVFVISKEVINMYCNAIVNDIKATREPMQGKSITYQRPIVVFADRYLRYKEPGSQKIEKLWDTLKAALRREGISFHELTYDVLDEDIQKMARSGEVTLTTIKYGRGADIRTSLDIIEGLHVIVGTPVLHMRLLSQLIGRTGRMGRQGSYSAITIGNLLMSPVNDQAKSSDFYAALHDITSFFVNKLLNSPYDADLCKKWLLFLGNSYGTRNYSNKINRGHANQLLGNYLQPNADLNRFIN